ncbi:MAG: hypothetical protein JO362_21870, partial [Streptomycetaceae bacterium]|nr:hypothetical protein [Streptomycetaceae bacterium]
MAPQESRAEVQAQAACTRAAALERVLRGDDKARLNVVDTKSLIADAREGAREAGRDLNTLLPGVRRLRRAAYQRLLHDAQQAVQEFARQPGSAAQQANGRVISGFTVTAVGDRGGHAALHHETGLRMVFNAGRRWGSRQYLLADAPPELDGLRMVVARTRRMWRASTLSYGLAGDSRRTARFDVAAVTGSMARTGGEYGKYQSAFIVTDLVTGHRYAFADEGTPTFRDIWVGDSHQMQGLGYLRYRDGAPDGVIPQVVDAQGKRLAGVRVEPHGDGELRLFPVVTPDVDAPLEHLVVEARTGRLLDQSIALRTSDGRIANGYWFLARDGSARRTNASGEVREAWPEIWSDEQDGQLAMIDSVTGATVWRRPFLGHGSDEGKLSPWLSRTGTVKRLPFTLPDRYELTVPYPNSSVAARISVCEQGLRLVNRFNDEAVDAPTELVRDGDQLSVRIPVPSDPHRAPAEFRFNEEGYLVSQEWPLTGLGDWPESRGVRVAMDRVSRGEPWHFGLTGPAGHVARFGIEALTEERALQLFGQGSAASMNPFVISERVGEHTTGIRRYYTPFTFRALVRWDTLLDDRTGLRLVATHYNGLRPGIGVPEVRNAADRPLSSFRVERLASGHLAVARDLQARDDPGLWLLDEAGGPAVRPEFDTPLMDGPEPDMPLLVHKRSLFVHRPVATEPDANGVTARFALPGGTDSVTAGYRFDRHGMLLHGEFPLTGGPEEAGELRVVMRWVQQQGGTEWPVWELKGTHAEDFDLRMLDLRDKILKKDVRAGFTLQERRTGVRRHYAVNGCLFYRDLPMRGGAYARLGVGVKEGTVRAVKKSGRQLQNWRGQLLDDGRVAMVPTVWDDMPETARPLTRFLLDPLHGMVEEILGVHRQGQNIPSCYWKFEYNSDTIGRVTLLDAAGNEIRHRPGSPRAAQASQAPRVVRTADFSTWMLVDSAGRPFYHSREAAVAGLGQLLDTAFARSRP